DRNEVGCAVILDVVGDCQPGVGQKVSKQEVDLFLLNETARLLKRRIRITGIIFNDHFDRPSSNRVVTFLPEHVEAFDDLASAGGDNAAYRSHQSDADRRTLRS